MRYSFRLLNTRILEWPSRSWLTTPLAVSRLVLGIANMWRRPFESQNLVVYRKTKISRRPGQRARLVAPAEAGEEYSYCVDKFWIIESVAPDGFLVVKTRRGKRHHIRQNDPNLRHASLRERLFSRARFPTAAFDPVDSVRC